MSFVGPASIVLTRYHTHFTLGVGVNVHFTPLLYKVFSATKLTQLQVNQAVSSMSIYIWACCIYCLLMSTRKPFLCNGLQKGHSKPVGIFYTSLNKISKQFFYLLFPNVNIFWRITCLVILTSLYL